MNPDPAVLLAEDNEDDLFLSSRVLAKASLQTVHHVADGREAIDYLAGRGPYADRVRHPLPDILLLDLKMPGHTGHEVLEWLRRQPGLQTITVYMLTSSDEPSDRRRAQKAGARGYIVKPLLPEHVSMILAEQARVMPGARRLPTLESAGTPRSGLHRTPSPQET
jgi:CheY-like chemotaxis protein